MLRKVTYNENLPDKNGIENTDLRKIGEIPIQEDALPYSRRSAICK